MDAWVVRGICLSRLRFKNFCLDSVLIILCAAVYIRPSAMEGANDRRAKLRRLDALRRSVQSATTNALEQILREIQKGGVPEVFSRQTMSEARSMLASAWTPYGPLTQTVDVALKSGASQSLLIVHPFAYIWHLVPGMEALSVGKVPRQAKQRR